jgi:hypothetical protein
VQLASARLPRRSVRPGRVRSDLDALREYLPSLGAIAEGTGSDYRYRARAKRGEVSKALAKLVQQIDYANFKDEVAAKQGEYNIE